MKDDFCDCYQRHRAGCNLVWSLATASTPTTFWRSRADDPQRDAAGGDAGGNRHNHGHIGWNPGQPRGGKTENERTSYRPTSVGLAHEMAHAYHSAGLGGTSNPHETNRTQAGRLEEEFSAVRAENQIRRELHEEAQRDLEKNPNSRLARERAARTEPRIEYTLGRESHRVPNHTGTNIDVADLFECDKPKRLAVPAPAPGPEPGKDIKKTLIPEDREGAFFIPGRSFSMTSNVSTDAQKFCSYGKATPRSVVLEPADADGNPLVVKSDPRLAFALAVLLAATTPMPIGNPDGAPQQGKPKEGGGSQTPGASAPSTPDAGTPAAKSPATPTATASVAPPKRPADTGILGAKLDGEFAEDVIDRFSKLAEEALARGDKEDFVRHREKVLEATQWVLDKHHSSAVVGVGNLTTEWKPYSKEVSGWERDPSKSPRLPKNDALLGVKLPNGQLVTDAIDKLSKSAEAARGSKENFETYRNALETIVQWATTKLESMPRTYSKDKVVEEWRTYENEVSGWQPQPRSASAEAAGGKPDATQKPTADAKPADPAVTPPRSSSPGEKSAPTPEKSTEKAETGDKPATPPAPPSDAAMPGTAGPRTRRHRSFQGHGDSAAGGRAGPRDCPVPQALRCPSRRCPSPAAPERRRTMRATTRPRSPASPAAAAARRSLPARS